uniref:ZP domain-containing protein n=1 Tax=Sphaeramia orbicularis TaxID=375764 RepID=A0A672YD76_9TELE
NGPINKNISLPFSITSTGYQSPSELLIRPASSPSSLRYCLLFTGTLVTSCDSCHNEATCQELQQRGDTLTSRALSCVCKEGFVGDGVSCYDTKLCSDSSCCSSGYHWSPEKGCVDTDECSLPKSPCVSPQVCRNTPGSFECLAPSSSSRSGNSSQSVQFYCGGTRCPTGWDCITLNGTSYCADPCEHYTVVDDAWRSVNNNVTVHCDQHVNWQGWYRMYLGGISASIPERCIEAYSCGTHAPMWLAEPHPHQSESIVTRHVCNTWNSDCCYFSSHTIHVKKCYGQYYVYKLVAPSACHLAYCAGIALYCFIPTNIRTVITKTGNQNWLINTNICFLDRLSGGISGVGSEPVAFLTLYRDPDYINAYPSGLTSLPVGSPMYVKVTVTRRDPMFVAVLEDCYSTYTPNLNDPFRYYMIQNKCPTDPQQVVLTESGLSLQARFSALLFLPEGEYRPVYLHCHLSLCNPRISRCVPFCRGRNARSVANSIPIQPLTIGPITCE